MTGSLNFIVVEIFQRNKKEGRRKFFDREKENVNSARLPRLVDTIDQFGSLNEISRNIIVRIGRILAPLRVYHRYIDTLRQVRYMRIMHAKSDRRGLRKSTHAPALRR